MLPDTIMSVSPLAYVTVALAVIWMVKSWVQQPRNLPPCPVRPLPFLGHIPFMRGRPRETMMEWRKKSGDIFSLYVGSRLAVVINTYDILKETLVKQADIFTDRPFNVLNNLVRDGHKGIIAASGPAWKEQRSVSMSILRDFGMGKNSLAEKIQEEVSAYLDEIGKVKGQPQKVRIQTNVAVANVICSIIVGRRFEYDDSKFANFMHLLNNQVKLIKTVSLMQAFAWLRFLPGDLFGIKQVLKNNEEMMNGFCDPFISLYSKKLDNNDADESVSFITSYLIELKHKQASGEQTTMEVGQLRKVIQNLFTAGSETTSTTMLWFMIYMLHYPDVQRKIFTEINDVVGTERVVSLHDKSQLNYLNAAIMETLRIASIVPFSLRHLCTAEVYIRGYTIPANTVIIPNLDAVLRDENTWGDPMNFRPERFLDKEGNILCPEEFVPFSLGRRVCLGESLAKMELFLFLSALIQRFELLPATPDHLPPLDYIFGITCPPAAYKIRFVERRTM